MVVKMMRWRPWPPLLSKKFEMRLIVRSLEGACDLMDEGADKERRFSVEIRWKAPKIALSSFRRTVKRNFTREELVGKGPNAVVRWDEEFQTVCSLSGYKDNVFHPWEITFTVFNGLNVGSKSRASVIGIASLNIAEYASATEQREFELSIPLAVSGSAANLHPMLCIYLSLLELRTAQEPTESVQRSIVPIPSSPQMVELSSTEKDEFSAIKAGIKKVRLFTEYVSVRRANKACTEEGSEGRCSARSEEGDYTYHFDLESLDDFDGRESEEGEEDSSVRKSFSYGTLAYANCAGRSYYSNISINGEDEDWIYYSNRKSDVGSSKKADSAASVSDPYASQNLKRGILPWRKRKLSFRSPKAKGEPLLKKDYGEEGGDDIDFDRRQLSSDESLSFWWQKTDEDSSANRSSVSDFGDDNFAVGTWEQKELTSRDGHMKLKAQVFFASIDQRSERAAGESACTALVAVIADWLQNNRDLMPIKSQFDSLIREGSLEWRNLCENETYRDRFPDKHFDLETVLQAEIHSLVDVPGKSFIGFFHPDGMEEGRFDFLHDAMSFDSIWDEISHAASECQSSGESQVYIVSWNDHFFILKVDPEAYYIIDTLGERLFEGCNQAYILKFDRDTTVYKLPSTSQSSEDKPACNQPTSPGAVVTKNQQSQQKNHREECADGSTVTEPEFSNKRGEEEELVCQGKESCKEYIKSFLAAIPIRELQVDIKRGLISSIPLHHRLQIEFHYTELQQKVPTPLAMEISPAFPRMMPQVAEAAITEVAA